MIYLAENPNNHIFIASANENFIGYLAVQIRQRQPFMEKLAEISEIYIEPAFRHLEIADKLFDKSLEWAKEKGIKWIAMPIYCKDESAINFWKKRGFRICGLKPSHDSGVDVCPPCAQSTSNKIA